MKPFATTLPLLTVCLVVGADSVAAQMSLPSLHDEHRSHASGTAWLPETTPLSSVTIHAGAWDVNAHWEAFVQRLDENGTRGGDQISSVNWMMGIGERRLGQGRVAVRGMFSLDSWTIGGCGYPNLLASGELCADEPLYDLQHPHDIFMEVAARYDRPLSHEFAIHVYAGLAGEPAIGPVAYMHRPSAAGNPLAPITHHWFDSSHVSFGVITTGLYRKQWKVEASLFNGREPDAQRSNIDWGPLDSRSARVWWMPTRAIAVQVSGAHLKEAEARPLHEGGGRIDVERLTASMTYHRLRPSGTLWATTIAWGRNVEPLRRTDALLIESALRLGAGHAWFTRYELSAKPSYDLGLLLPGACAAAHCPTPAANLCCDPTDDTVPSIVVVSRTQIGYVRYVNLPKALRIGIGASASLSVVPKDLEPYYGSRATLGSALFLSFGSRVTPPHSH